jgi:NADH-quinone oxidoreductase subunit C
MDKKQLAELIKTVDQDLEPVEGKQFAEVTVAPEKLHETCLKLRNNKELPFDFLDCITGVDYGQDLGVIYHLMSAAGRQMIVVKSRTADRVGPHFDSVCDIWKSAEFLEREVYDLLGIKFTGHPDLRRLFLDSSWGYPLRKDYTDDINIVTK